MSDGYSGLGDRAEGNWWGGNSVPIQWGMLVLVMPLKNICSYHWWILLCHNKAKTTSTT